MVRWNKQERDAIAEVRARMGDLLTNRPQYPEVVGDRKIVRFLRGHDYDIEKIVNLYTNFLKWRDEKNVDLVRDNIVTGKNDHPSKFPYGDRVLTLLPHIVMAPFALDKEGSPICVDQYNFSPSAVLEQISLDEYIEFVTYGLEYRSIILEQMSEQRENEYLNGLSDEERNDVMNNEEITFGVLANTCVIRDLGGVGFEHLGSQGQSIIKAVVSLASDNYPEMMKKCYMINTPWIFNTIWYFIKGLLSTKTINKVSIIGSTYQEELEATIPKEFIPKLIGGEYSGGIEYESYPFDLKYLGVLNVTAPPAEADSN